jgi:integrase
MKLTQHAVDTLSLPVGKDDWIAWDDDVPGFGLRFRKGGSRTFVFWYRVGSRRRKMPIGSATAIKASDARKRASILHAEAKLGRDPASAKESAKARAGETLGAKLVDYLAHQRANLRPRSFVSVEHALMVHAKRLHGMPIDTIGRRDVASLLSAIAQSKSDATANRTRASLSAFFGWAIREGLLEVNPVALTERREEKSRDRVLTDQELAEIWAALKDDAYGAIVKLLMLTGARREEIGALRWSEVDLDKALISLPPARTKADRAHNIPLSPPALTILQVRPRLTWPDGSPCDLVFGRGAKGFSDWVGSKADLDGRITKRRAEPLTPWTLHDFRRTLSTIMHDRLGVLPHVVEACLGHVGHKRGVAGIYNRASYDQVKAVALATWADYLLAVVEGRERKVVPLSRA